MVEVINPEQYRKIRELEIGDDWLPEEIWENQNDLEEDLQDRILIKRGNRFLEYEVDSSNVLQTTIQKTIPFCEEIIKLYACCMGNEKPSFYIYLGSEREKILEGQNIAHPLKKDSLFLAFNQPTSLTFPLPEEESWEDWHFSYTTLRSNFWEKLHKYKQKHSLNFDRINPVGDHTLDYYYLFEVSLASKRKKKLTNT